MTPEEISVVIKNALKDACTRGDIDLDTSQIPDKVVVERPRQREHGDWATNIALQLAKKAHTNPRTLATILEKSLSKHEGIESVDIAGPGFINMTLAKDSAGRLAATILLQSGDYGCSEDLEDLAVNLEFVSANPTGPIHLGGARWAAVGDALARVLEACGATVVREYYFNDHGAQIDRFAQSLLCRARQQPTPEDGYGGQYIDDIAAQVIADEKAENDRNPADLDDAQAQEIFRKRGVELMFDSIKERLSDFGVDFDVFFHEESLHESGAVAQAIAALRERGVIYEHEGATWIKSTEFGDDKDRVLIKSDGEAAYFAADLAYYLDKRQRGSNCNIYLFGADHHGYVGRMMAMCAAFGDEPGVNLQIIIGQMVNLLKGGEPVRMSKRAGNVVTLDDLVDAVGVDAARYSLTRASMDSTIDIDLDLLVKHSNDNPVYYVQYAHARTCNVAKNANQAGVLLKDAEGYDPAALDTEADSNLLAHLAQYPAMVLQAARLREPHRVAHYLEELASAYHAWYGKTRVSPRAGDEVNEGHIARLALNNATRQVLANGLKLMGVSAPERM
ncbi:MAG: arginine--tRNA ligase [Actinomycetaceae bacterium]|nr:arginine--tRNA ligase [Actinomycetaceae bacterium]